MVKCKYCGKTFKNQYALGGHITIHYGSHGRTTHCEVGKCLNCNKSIIWTTTTKKVPPKYCCSKCRYEYERKLRESTLIKINGAQLDITRKQLKELRSTITACQICGKSIEEIKNENNHFTNLCVDHDHNTNAYRGLLCLTCNLNLAWYEKNKQNIIKYLDK